MEYFSKRIARTNPNIINSDALWTRSRFFLKLPKQISQCTRSTDSIWISAYRIRSYTKYSIDTQYNYYSIYLIGGTGGGRKAGLRSYGSSFAPLEPEEPDEFNWDWEIFGYVMLVLSGIMFLICCCYYGFLCT